MNNTTVTPQSWARALLQAMHLPVTANNMTTILAWEYAEGGHFHNGAHWNPLNTTRDSARYGTLPGNTAGVAVYPNYATGLAETVATLKLPYYDTVRRDLAASAAPSVTTAAIAASPWGTWHGSSPGPIVARAAHDVHDHPSWVKTTGTGGGHKTTTHKTTAHKTTHKTATHKPVPQPKHKPAPKPKHKPTGSGGGAGRGSQPAGGGSGGGSGSGSGTIVLDLPELGSLSSTYTDASDRATMVRRRLQDLAEDLAPARAALPDTWLSTTIGGLFDTLTTPMTGFDSNARQLADIADYTGRIRTLAQQADANDNGKYSTAEKVRFLETHPYHKNDRAWAAVVAALEGGVIRRTKSVTSPSSSGTHTAKAKPKSRTKSKPKHTPTSKTKPKTKPKTTSKTKPKTKPKSKPKTTTTKHAHPSKPAPTTSARTKRVDAVVALASKQHAVEHDGNNVVKYNEWYGDPGQPWCATFVSWVFSHAGSPLPPIQGPKGFAYVPYAISYARAHHQLSATPHVGDIFLYKDGEHTGIVTKVYPNGTFDTVEGNWSNQVSRLHRNSHDGTYYFWTAIR